MDQQHRVRWSWRKLSLPRLPVKFSDLAVGILAAGAAGAIVINAVALQSGPHPAPLFAGKPLKSAAEPTGSVVTALPRPRPPELEAARVAAAPPRPKAEPSEPALKIALAPPARLNAAGVKRTNANAEPVTAPKQLAAIQRALADFGYGQVKPSGVVDADTRAAIEKFERERKLPVTGQVSERVVRELAAMTGRGLN
jgi:hypothetical protein